MYKDVAQPNRGLENGRENGRRNVASGTLSVLLFYNWHETADFTDEMRDLIRGFAGFRSTSRLVKSSVDLKNLRALYSA